MSETNGSQIPAFRSQVETQPDADPLIYDWNRAEHQNPLGARGLMLLDETLRMGEMAAALEKVAGKEATALLDWQADPAIEKLVRSWPGDVAWDRARGLGLKSDASFEAIVREYIAENPQAVRLAVR